jgi:hypothetical protein
MFTSRGFAKNSKTFPNRPATFSLRAARVIDSVAKINPTSGGFDRELRLGRPEVSLSRY